MISMLISSAVDCGFEPQSGKTKDYKSDICCCSAKHAAVKRKSKDWFAQNQNNVFNFSTISWEEKITFNEMIMMSAL
jgi:hypothetical protein